MMNNKNINGLRALDIAKVYLLNYGELQLMNDSKGKFDFIALKKNDLNKQIAIDIKATKYSKSEIIAVYKDYKKKLVAREKIPILIMYINYDEENGFFEIFNIYKKRFSPLESITVSALKNSLDKILD